MPARYEIRVAGQLDETATSRLAGLDVSTRRTVTIITGEFDQAALHGLFERIRSLGLELIEARRVRACAAFQLTQGRQGRSGRTAGEHSSL